MLKRFTFLVIFYFILTFHLLSQKEIVFDHITTENGLSQNDVRVIIQDYKGFIWIGTHDGLNRFDGYNSKIFKHNPLDSNSLGDNRVYSLLEDSEKNLWVGTRQGGLNLYDRDNERFIQFKHDPNNSNSLTSNWVNRIYEDSNKNLWIGTIQGLCLFDRKTQKITRFTIDANNGQTLPLGGVFSIFEDSNGDVWVAFDYGLYKKDKNLLTSNHNINIKEVNCIIEDSKGDLLFGTNYGLYTWSRDEESMEHFAHDPNSNSLSNNMINDMYEYNGLIWIATDAGGLNIFDKDSKKFVHITTNDYRTNLNSNSIWDIYEDNQGNIWLAVMRGGCNFWSIYKNKFRHYKKEIGNSNSLIHNNVFSFCEGSDGKIWIGTDGGGLNLFDKVNDKFNYYVNDPNDLKSLSGNAIPEIAKDKDGNIWIVTYENGLNMYNKKNNGFIHYSYIEGDKNSFRASLLWSVYADKRGDLWIGGVGNALHKFEKKLGVVAAYSKNTILDMLEDSKGNFWIGTEGNGLNLFDRDKEIFTRFVHDENDSTTISSNYIKNIFEDSKQNLWIGTDGGGINLYKPENSSFINYKEEDGLPNNTIYAILEDDDDNLWISTNNGLSKFNIYSKKIRNYTKSDGLQDKQFSIAALKTKDGEMFFGGINGFNRFYPSDIKDNPNIPPVLITNFSIFNKSIAVGEQINGKVILEKNITQTEEIVLSYRENVFSFGFVALDYIAPDKNQYSYILEGFDKQWVRSDSKIRRASYTNLDAGTYFFKVKASNSDGIWNNEPTVLKIIILPPWWETWWAYMVYILIIMLILYASRKLILLRAKLKNEILLEHLERKKEAELNQSKLKFFTNISHEFRTPLTLILGPLEKIINHDLGKEDLKRQHNVMQRNANRLYRLIDQLMDFRKFDTGQMKLHAEEDDIVKFIREVSLSFEERARQKNIILDVTNCGEPIITYFDKDKFEKIIFNLLSNAFKFTTEKGVISLSAKSLIYQTNLYPQTNKRNKKKNGNDEKYIEIVVKDSGIGIPSKDIEQIFNRFYKAENSELNSQSGTGIGLALTKEMIELHKGEIKVESNVGIGTRFIIRLPFLKDILDKSEIEEVGAKKPYIPKLKPVDVEIEENPEPSLSQDKDVIINNKLPLILIVDDDTDILNFIDNSLKPFYRIIKAENGIIGLNSAEKFNPDLIISDVMMPEMDGIELCEKIKTNLKISHIPIILLTAKTTIEDKIKGLDTGADAYIAKPFSMELLLVQIRNLLESRKKLREMFGRKMMIEPSEVTITSTDEKFLKKAVKIVENNIDDVEFSVDNLGQEIGLSRSQLHRKLKALTSQSTTEFIRLVRLKRAAQLLKQGKQNIDELSYMVGFNTPNYFSKCFRLQFGVTPTEFLEQNRK